MNDDEELEFGGHNGGWRSPYPWWRSGWQNRPVYVPVPVQTQVRSQALLAPEQCPEGYYLDSTGKCRAVTDVAGAGVTVGVVGTALVGLALVGVWSLLTRR